MALYRKYRPQKLLELDSQTLGKRLSTIFTAKDLPHAFLFAGPKGTGKTSTARIIAKLINCEKRKPNSSNSSTPSIPSEPCNSCDTCISITEGRHLDILEIDAASNRGIDEIRELRENIKLSPVSARYKVYIIDEAHMLTTEAFNALLKTLEEPPAHAIFILATTEVNKLPATIVSRCMVFQFEKANTEEMLHALHRVVAGEKVTIEEEGLKRIAEYADGSFRDGTKILEQAIAEKALTAEAISSLFAVHTGQIETFTILLKEKKAKEALELVLALEREGGDAKIFVSSFLKHIHGCLLAQYGIGSASKDLTVRECTALIKLFSRVFTELKNTTIPTLPIEVAVVEWCETK